MPEGICDRGIRDLNGVVQLPCWSRSGPSSKPHTGCSKGFAREVGMGKHRRFKSWNHPSNSK